MDGALPIGRQWPAHSYEVGREKIREYAAAVGIDLPWHREHGAARERGYRAVVAPSTFAAVYAGPAVASVMFDPTVGIFDPELGLAGYRFVQRTQEFEWGAPVCSGDTISTVATLLEAGNRNGIEYRIFGSTSTNDTGDVVVRGRYEGVVPTMERGTRAPTQTPQRTLRTGVRGDIHPSKEGQHLTPLCVEPDRTTPVRYAGASGDFTPIHLDAAFAKAAGLPDVILHGLYTFALLARGVCEPLGGDPRTLRLLAARFRRPAMTGSELSVHAAVASVRSDGREFACEVLQGGRAVLDQGRAVVSNHEAPEK